MIHATAASSAAAFLLAQGRSAAYESGQACGRVVAYAFIVVVVIFVIKKVLGL